MPCDTVRDYERIKERERQLDRAAKRKRRLEAAAKVKAQALKTGWVITRVKNFEYTASKPYSTDKLEIKILDSGTVRVSAGKISAANHASAEMFLNCIQAAMGGPVTVKQKSGTVAHSHGGLHTHTH